MATRTAVIGMGKEDRHGAVADADEYSFILISTLGEIQDSIGTSEGPKDFEIQFLLTLGRNKYQWPTTARKKARERIWVRRQNILRIVAPPQATNKREQLALSDSDYGLCIEAFHSWRSRRQ
jgi:hypothetical protein